MEIDPRGIVGGTSRPAVALVKAIVKDTIQRDEEVWLDVNNIEAQA